MTFALKWQKLYSAQQVNLCNVCAHLWEDCSALSAEQRTVRRFVNGPRSSGCLVTVRCSGFNYWPERGKTIPLEEAPFIFGSEVLL